MHKDVHTLAVPIWLAKRVPVSTTYFDRGRHPRCQWVVNHIGIDLTYTVRSRAGLGH